ncbi:unnamed protein product [Amoebophrya sp. A25]|nr:unnamed protein product [Amoebophrya sp. A25]|eukprot:GSA25T00013473001.1
MSFCAAVESKERHVLDEGTTTSTSTLLDAAEGDSPSDNAESPTTQSTTASSSPEDDYSSAVLATLTGGSSSKDDATQAQQLLSERELELRQERENRRMLEKITTGTDQKVDLDEASDSSLIINKDEERARLREHRQAILRCQERRLALLREREQLLRRQRSTSNKLQFLRHRRLALLQQEQRERNKADGEQTEHEEPSENVNQSNYTNRNKNNDKNVDDNNKESGDGHRERPSRERTAQRGVRPRGVRSHATRTRSQRAGRARDNQNNRPRRRSAIYQVRPAEEEEDIFSALFVRLLFLLKILLYIVLTFLLILSIVPRVVFFYLRLSVLISSRHSISETVFSKSVREFARLDAEIAAEELQSLHLEPAQNTL